MCGHCITQYFNLKPAVAESDETCDMRHSQTKPVSSSSIAGPSNKRKANVDRDSGSDFDQLDSKSDSGSGSGSGSGSDSDSDSDSDLYAPYIKTSPAAKYETRNAVHRRQGPTEGQRRSSRIASKPADASARVESSRGAPPQLVSVKAPVESASVPARKRPRLQWRRPLNGSVPGTGAGASRWLSPPPFNFASDTIDEPGDIKEPSNDTIHASPSMGSIAAGPDRAHTDNDNTRLSHTSGRVTSIVRDKQPLVSSGVVQTTPGARNALGHNTRPSYAAERDTNIVRKREPRVLTAPSALRTTAGTRRASDQITRPRYTEDRDANITRDKQPLAPPRVAQTTQHTGNTSHHSARPSNAEERDANVVREKQSLASPVQTIEHTPNVSYYNAGPSSAQRHDANIVHNMQPPPPTSPGAAQTRKNICNAFYRSIMTYHYADKLDANGLQNKRLFASLNVESGPHGPDILVGGAILNYDKECDANHLYHKQLLASLKPPIELKEMLLENHGHPQPSNIMPDIKRKAEAGWDSDTDEKPLAKMARTNSENICSSPRNQQKEATKLRG